MQGLQEMLMRQMPGGQQGVEVPLPDNSEQLYISSLALIKMLKHCKNRF